MRMGNLRVERTRELSRLSTQKENPPLARAVLESLSKLGWEEVEMKSSTYSKIAQAVKKSEPCFIGKEYLIKILFLSALADILADDNPKFNRAKFMEECK